MKFAKIGLLVLGLAALGCDGDVQTTDSGGVLLQLDLGETFPYRVSVNGSDAVQLDMTIQSIATNSDLPTSELMNVILESLEVTFTRIDGGTRTPPPFFRSLAGVVPVNGSLDYFLTVMTSEQMRGAPLSDLLFENGGFDKETGKTNIKLDLTFRFFGRTLGGQELESVPRTQTFEFVP